MMGAGIHPEDILVVERSLKAKHNSIVIAVLNRELTAKRLKLRSNRCILAPENLDYSEIMITEEMDFRVWGCVILLSSLIFIKIYALYFICTKTIDRNWDYKPTKEIINSQYRNSPYEDKADRVTLHDIYHCTIPHHVVVIFCIFTGFPFVKIINLAAFFQLFILPVVITSFAVFLINLGCLRERKCKWILFLDLTLLSMVYWSICGDIYCTFHLKPHYPLMDPELGYLILGIGMIPVMTLLAVLIRHYVSAQFLSTAQGRAYSISFVLSIFFLLGAPHQFNKMMLFTFTGGGRPILITDSQKKVVKGSYIFGGLDYFIAWPESTPEPLKYLRAYSDFQPLPNSGKKNS